jgi:hypothetical protein
MRRLDITSDLTLKQEFNLALLIEFWYRLFEEYRDLSNCAVLKCLPFPTTYLHEVGFSRYVATKNVETDRMLHLTWGFSSLLSLPASANL